MKVRYQDWRFFRRNAGYVVGERAIGAFRLARAEMVAENAGWVAQWEHDPDGDLGDHEVWCPEAEEAAKKGKRPKCEHEVLSCVLLDMEERNPLASLGSIIDPSPEYRRVVEAELALEAMERNREKLERLVRGGFAL